MPVNVKDVVLVVVPLAKDVLDAVVPLAKDVKDVVLVAALLVKDVVATPDRRILDPNLKVMFYKAATSKDIYANFRIKKGKKDT
jgi:Asp-tRNA(Asn)/Glu-tRNA(Gln) amidotransferase A subunit family amidase